MVDVYLDEKYIGKVENANEFVEGLKESRRKKDLPSSLNVFHDETYDEVYINLTNGRARRPLIVVKDGKNTLTKEMIGRVEKGELTWDQLVENGVIEYIDAAEEENIYVALKEEDVTKEHTHLEIASVGILGLITSLVPYANYVQSSRLLVGSKNQKQAIGLYASNYLLRMDTDVSVLHNPQIPITKSFVHDVFDFDDHPAGQNLIVAEMSYEGYNMEDAMIVNKGSIERGMSRSTYYKPYSIEELRYSGGLMDEIGVPDKEVKGYRTEEEYKHLENDGIVYAGTEVNPDDVLVGKTSPPRFLGEMEDFSFAANTRRESSIVMKQGEAGVVDMVAITENEEGNKLVQVRVRDQRIPEVGDKFTSRHGQKGVIGLSVPEVDLPFTSLGITPDVIHSPHSIPSRLTVSHLVEVIAGKVGAMNGRYVDGTTFDVEDENSLRKELFGLGFREGGTETMYNGITGERMKVKIYIGNMYYLRLKHMVANKLHARASGRIQLLTRQPIEGRAKGGGLRLGEMEKDCFVAHGASLLLKERFDSDKTILHICENCGMLAISDSLRGRQYCNRCGNNTEVTPIEISYAFKLLLDELKSLGIHPKMVLKSKY